MKSNIYQELYKMSHRKSIWLGPLVLLGFMLIGALTFPDGGRWIFISGYASTLFSIVICVAVSASIFADEYQNRTILALCYRSTTRFKIYFAKFFAIMVYDVYLLTWCAGIALIFNQFGFFHATYSLTQTYLFHQPLWMNLLSVMGATWLQSLLVMGMVFMIASWMKSNLFAIIAGLVITLLGQGWSDSLLNVQNANFDLLKWNPLNMLNFASLVANYSVYYDSYGLTIIQECFGLVVYTLLFLGLGYLIFRKKRV
jgi:ABC-2 type transport system permease protein